MAPSPRPRGRALAPKLALLGASIAVGLAFVEGAVRAFDVGPRFEPLLSGLFRLSDDPTLRYELLPGARDGAQAINAHGMRDRERAREKPPGTFRIAVLGDSLAFGLGTLQSLTFPAHLERILAERFRTSGLRIEVLNFGVSGYSLEQSLAMLRQRALAFEPDVVLLVYCLNDPEDQSFELAKLRSALSRAQRNYRERVLGRAEEWLRFSRAYALARYLWESRTREGAELGSMPEDEQWEAVQEGTWPDYYARLHTEPDTWSRVETGFDELRALTRGAGVPAWVVIFPILERLDEYPLREIHARVARAARQRGLGAIDLQPAYTARIQAGDRDLVFNALHPNGRGHQLAAHVVAAHLARSGARPPPAADPGGRRRLEAMGDAR